MTYKPQPGTHAYQMQKIREVQSLNESVEQKGKVIVDFAYDEDDETDPGLEGNLNYAKSRFKRLNFEIIKATNQNGWPEVEVTGDIDQLKAYLIFYSGGDKMAAADLMNDIEYFETEPVEHRPMRPRSSTSLG